MSEGSEKQVLHKWGFGMSMPKAATDLVRREAAQALHVLLDTCAVVEGSSASLSEMKGLFNRVWRRDQWDWFTVSGQLGYPSPYLAKVIAGEIERLRIKVKNVEIKPLNVSDFVPLRRLPVRRCIAVLLGKGTLASECDAGWVYVLSTREQNSLVKIGMTTRTVEERVKELNSATAVAFPYGVTSCWRVRTPRIAESIVHQELKAHRLRTDREFFNLNYRDAHHRISEVLKNSHLELRTLDDIVWA